MLGIDVLAIVEHGGVIRELLVCKSIASYLLTRTPNTCIFYLVQVCHCLGGIDRGIGCKHFVGRVSVVEAESIHSGAVGVERHIAVSGDKARLTVAGADSLGRGSLSVVIIPRITTHFGGTGKGCRDEGCGCKSYRIELTRLHVYSSNTGIVSLTRLMFIYSVTFH